MLNATDMVVAAKAVIENLDVEQVARELELGANLIDLRERSELERDGTIAGAVHAPRGMLEFYADPTLPYHMDVFDRGSRLILHCASGGRSALACRMLKEMGYANVAHLDGGFRAWRDAAKPVQAWTRPTAR